MEQFRLKWNKSTEAAADLQFLLGATGWLWRANLLHPVCLEPCSFSRLSWDGRGKVSILLDKLPTSQVVGLGRFTIWRKLFPDFKDWELTSNPFLLQCLGNSLSSVLPLSSFSSSVARWKFGRASLAAKGADGRWCRGAIHCALYSFAQDQMCW